MEIQVQKKAVTVSAEIRINQGYATNDLIRVERIETVIPDEIAVDAEIRELSNAVANEAMRKTGTDVEWPKDDDEKEDE